MTMSNSLNVDDLRKELTLLERFGVDEDDDDEKERFEKLKALRDAMGDDWEENNLLVHEDDLKELAMDRADDQGMKIGTWPMMHVDWEAAANDLTSDMTTVEFDDETYYYG